MTRHKPCSSGAMHDGITETLEQHLGLCRELLSLSQMDNDALRRAGEQAVFATGSSRQELLPRLEASLQALRERRAAWQQTPATERAGRPEILSLLQRNQEIIMSILMLDRENEQALLRRGLVPSRHLPPAARQRPHFVADLYRRSGLASAHAD